MTQNKKLIIIAAVILIILGLAGALIYFASRGASNANSSDTGSNADVTLRVDPDTGEQTTSDPSLGQSESEDAKDTTLLGVEAFITATNITRQQVLYLRDSLHAYSSTVLKNKYGTLTIRPDDTVVNGGTATGTIRLGDSDSLVNFKYDGLQGGTLQLTVTDSTGKNGGNYAAAPQQYFEND